MGAIWNLPIVYVCENNLYGASTHQSKVMKIKDIRERASSYGIPGKVADGNPRRRKERGILFSKEQSLLPGRYCHVKKRKNDRRWSHLYSVCLSALIDNGSQEFKSLYNRRTSIKRCFSRLLNIRI